MEMDTDNHGVQNLLLTAENIPELKKYDMPGLWKFTSAFKSVFPAGNAMSPASKFSSPNCGPKRLTLTEDPYKGMGCWKLYHLNKQNRYWRQCWWR